ncbi:MAG: tetratricopeptide repeat protein [Candidatus Rokubacteria bacterium]|nr:tetratricopeptide repeat protein [Candidatus Rokubacteria bacterium]
MRRLAFLIVLFVALGPASATGVRQLSREQALAALKNRDNVEARRQGVAGLGDTGVMADVPLLVEALRDPDHGVRALAEQSLWQVWSRSGDSAVDSLFEVGIEQMNQRDADAAIKTFSLIIQKKPDFAEGWNKRATLYYVIGEYEKSLADCEEVIRLNPVHFGALSGFGMIYLQLGKPQRALDYFQRALAVNPNLDQVEIAVEELKQLLIRQRRGTI